MELFATSLVIGMAGLCGLVCFVARRHEQLERRHNDLLDQVEELQSAMRRLQQRFESLQAEKKSVAPNTAPLSTPDMLAVIERLGDCDALGSSYAMESAASAVAAIPPGVDADLFGTDDRVLSISRLMDQGCTESEIARRLQLPIGEVELLASTRAK